MRRRRFPRNMRTHSLSGVAPFLIFLWNSLTRFPVCTVKSTNPPFDGLMNCWRTQLLIPETQFRILCNLKTENSPLFYLNKTYSSVSQLTTNTIYPYWKNLVKCRLIIRSPALPFQDTGNHIFSWTVTPSQLQHNRSHSVTWRWTITCQNLKLKFCDRSRYIFYPLEKIAIQNATTI
jgi:hypothetical protein